MKVVRYSVGILLLLIGCSEMEIKWVKKVDVAGPGHYRISDLSSYHGVYTTGTYWGPEQNLSCVTTHYNEYGELVWSSIYKPHNLTQTEGVAILPLRHEITENKPEVFVLIHAIDVKKNNQVLLVKYDSLGTLAYESLVEQSPDEITSVLLSNAQNNIYVVGWKKNSKDSIVIFISNHRPSGELIWLREYYNPSYRFSNIGFDMVGSGQCVIGGIEENTFDLFFMTCDELGNFSNVTTYETPEHEDMLADIIVTSGGIVYLTGVSLDNETGYNYLTLAYDKHHTVLWSQQFDGETHLDDMAKAIAVDDSFNLYVTGSSEIQKNITEIVTIKYDRDGNEVWTKHFRGRKEEIVESSFLQPTFLGYKKGSSVSNFSIVGCIDNDVLILRYNTNGHVRWTKRYGEGAENRPTVCSGDYVAIESKSDDIIDALIMKYGRAEQFGIIRWD